ncbi:histone deacetylase [Vibrio caribbeanicus]|uniref:histone deacetylase family protein n=1 Tax=Vibrio caribbeanicus TaxID=701175 RepID=UPI0022845337|nr:histone deacetylase [Vibrio caribbeanicus]MCY9844601.1 histone deacetylase [Vibrio caribbeanicus]
MIPLIYHPIYSQLPLPEGHRYPINKYRLLFDAIEERCNEQPSWRQNFHFVEPTPLTLNDVEKVHNEAFVNQLASGTLPGAKMRRIGFPWSEQLIKRTLTSAGGTCETVKQALSHGVAVHLSGGYHHAHYDFGSGFCLFNDLVLAARSALQLEGIGKVLIVDSDVHHGDGTASLCNGDERIVTLSFHCDKNFPARKPESDLDVPFCRDTGDDEFLNSFTSIVEMAVNMHQPDCILYDAGVDIHTDDELGYLDVSTVAIYKRDVFMFNLAKRYHLPIACVVGGGYRSNHSDLVPIHLQLVRASLTVFGN